MRLTYDERHCRDREGYASSWTRGLAIICSCFIVVSLTARYSSITITGLEEFFER